MKKIKDVSDEDDYEVDDPDDPEVEGASEEDWAPEPGAEVRVHAALRKHRFSILRRISIRGSARTIIVKGLGSFRARLSACQGTSQPTRTSPTSSGGHLAAASESDATREKKIPSRLHRPLS